MKRIGYIGLGLMGAPMARNLLKAGFEVVVHNRSHAIVDQLVGEGAVAATSPREVAAQVEVVCTNLPDSPDVEQVVLGANGIQEGAHPGLIYVDHSTIKPETARKIAAALAEKGVAALDAPVSGGQVGAQNGTLAIMAGGDKAAFDSVEPMFKAVGRRWTLVGGPGAGQVAKACNQIMVGAQMAALAELLALAQANDVDPFAVTEAIKDGAAQCWTLDNKPPRLKQGIRTPGFKAYMQLKDLKIVADTARASHLDLPLNSVLVRLFQTMIDDGAGELDNSALINVYEHANNLHIGPK